MNNKYFTSFICLFSILALTMTSCVDKPEEEVRVIEEEVQRDGNTVKTVKNFTIYVVDKKHILNIGSAANYAIRLGGSYEDGRSMSISVSMNENSGSLEQYLKLQFGEDARITYKSISLNKIKSIKKIDIICNSDFNETYKKGKSLNSNLKLDYPDSDGNYYYSTMELDDFNSGGKSLDWYDNNKSGNGFVCRVWTKISLPKEYAIHYVKNINDKGYFEGFENTIRITFADGSVIVTRPFPTIAF